MTPEEIALLSAGAALLGALIGALGGIGATLLTLKHNEKRRWDADRVGEYMKFLTAASALDSKLIETAMAINRWHKAGGGDLDSFGTAVTDLPAQLRVLRDRYFAALTGLMIHASQKVIDAAYEMADALELVPEVFASLEIDQRVITVDQISTAQRKVSQTMEMFALACREDLKIKQLSDISPGAAEFLGI